MSKKVKRKTIKAKARQRNRLRRIPQKNTGNVSLHIPSGDASFWGPFEVYNRLDPKLRAEALKKLGIETAGEEVLGQLTKSHFVIPGKTRYECRLCGECCRYARSVATFSYEPCTFLGTDNLCTKHDNRYQVCKWFPFWVYPDQRYGNLLTIKPYCTGYGHGELVDYAATVKRLVALRKSTVKEPDGAEVIHEVIYLPTREAWVFPSQKNVDELIGSISGDKFRVASQCAQRRRAQLEHARRYTSGLLSGVNEANITVNREGIVTDGNDEAASLFQRRLEQFKGRQFTDLFSDPEKTFSILKTCFAVGKVTGLTQKILHEDNKTVPVLCNAMTYRDNVDGMVNGVLVAFRPITEHAYSELEQSRNYARSLIESSFDLMVTFDRDGIITDVNEAAEKMTGCTGNELIGKKFREFFTSPEQADKGIDNSFENGKVKDYQLKLKTRSGKVIPVSFNATVYKDLQGTVQGVFAVARDVSEIHKLMSELEQAHNYARGLIEASLDMMITFDKDGFITDVNEAAVRFTGQSREQLIGAKLHDYCVNRDMADIGITKSFEKEMVKNYKLDLKNSFGETVPFLFNSTVYKDCIGEVAGVFATAREIRGRHISC